VLFRSAVLDADRLGHRDLYVVDVAAVPERLENAVAEPEDEDVLRGFLAEIVVDAEDLPLAEDVRKLLVQRARRLQVAPERFLHDEPRPRTSVHTADEARLAEVAHDAADRRRRDRKIIEAVA